MNELLNQCLTPGDKCGDCQSTVSAGETPTSRDDAKTLQDECLCLLQSRDLTADECAGLLRVSVLSIRPRVSELRRAGLVFKTELRRQNLSGHSATVWSAQTRQE